MASIKEKLRQKILNKWNLSLEDKILLEKIENTPEEELLKQLLVKKLNKIKKSINTLEQKELAWIIAEEELDQLKKLTEIKKEIISKIRQLREEENLSIDEFNKSEIDWLSLKWIWDITKDISNNANNIWKELILDIIFSIFEN